MAITKVGTYRNPPEDKTDYEAIVAHLEAYTRQIGNQGMILTEWANTSGTPAIAMGSYISHGGVLYVVDSEEAVALPVSDGTYYLMVAASGDTLALSWISSLSGYAWNAIANGLYHADESQVLPYQVVKNGALVEKYKMLNPWQNDDFAVVNYLGRYHGRELHVTGAISGASVGVTGAISGATINTGGLGNFLIGQNLRTTDSPTFATVNATDVVTTNGPNKPVDNNDASMPSVNIGGFSYATASSSSTKPSITIGSGGTWVYVQKNSKASISSIYIGRVSGGTVLQGQYQGDGEDSSFINVIAWRIA